MDEQREQDQQHEEWLAEIGEQLAPIFANSTEGVYVYFDDRHKICNDKLAKMWGFGSAAEWARTPDFLNSFVATHADRLRVSQHYHKHIHQRLAPSRFRFTVRRPDGKLVACETDMVPLAFSGEMFAYQFVRPLRGAKRAKAKTKAKPKARRRR